MQTRVKLREYERCVSRYKLQTELHQRTRFSASHWWGSSVVVDCRVRRQTPNARGDRRAQSSRVGLSLLGVSPTHGWVHSSTINNMAQSETKSNDFLGGRTAWVCCSIMMYGQTYIAYNKRTAWSKESVPACEASAHTEENKGLVEFQVLQSRLHSRPGIVEEERWFDYATPIP